MPMPSYAAETERVAAHLLRAERTARKRDLAGLSPAQRLVRALLLGELERYRLRERFPQNPQFAEPTPTFVDAAGTPCAVAHMLELSGERAFVRRVARERNHARVRELTNEPRLLAWLSAAGLTVEEAALIQPGYQVYNGTCLCGDDWSSVEPLTGSSPADGVLVGTALDITSDMSRMRITAIYGNPSSYFVGQEVAVDLRESNPIDGAQLVAPVHVGSSPNTSDAGEVRLEAVMLGVDGTYSCHDYGSMLGPLTEAQLVQVLRAPDCDQALKDINPDFGRRWHDDSGLVGSDEGGGCALSPHVADAPSTVGILLSLVAAIVGGRSALRIRPPQ